MADSLEGARNRRYSWASAPWTAYVGDLKALETFLDARPGPLWLLPKFLDSLLRGVGQVVFANNPISGLLILLAMFWAGLQIGLATVLAASTAILTAVVMRMESGNIRAGLTTFNAVLVGSVTSSLWTLLFNEPLSAKIWIFLVIGSVFSVFVTSGLGNILSKWNLPVLTLPFNVVTLLLFVCLMPPAPTAQNPSPVVENGATTGVDWLQIGSGSILSMGEVWAVDTFGGSILIIIALLIYSPLLCLMSCIGAIIGTTAGLLFVHPAAYGSSIYIGLWGYNGVLSAAAIGGFFFAPSCHSILTAILNVFFTVLIQRALALSLAATRLPVFTLPFVLSTLIFLSVTSSGKYLKRVTDISFPEMHRYDYIQEIRIESNLIREENERKEAGKQVTAGN